MNEQNLNQKYYKIRKQNNQRGYQAGFVLTCNLKENDNSLKCISLTLDEYAKQWEKATLQGVDIFYEENKNQLKGRLQININRIDWFPVDTNGLLITYAIIRVLCNYFKLQYLPILNQPEFETLYFLNDLSFESDDDINFYI